MFNTEQFTAAGKANLDAAVEIGQKAFGGIEKLVELNLQVTRAALDESAAHAKALLAVKDPQELLALQSGALQPAAEKATAYGRQVYEIASSTQADISKLLEAQAAGAQEKFQGFVEAAAEGGRLGLGDYIAAQQARARYGAAMDQLLADYELLLSPATACLPFAAGREFPEGSGPERWTKWAGFSYPINLSQQPRTSSGSGPIAASSPRMPRRARGGSPWVAWLPGRNFSKGFRKGK